MKNVIYMGATGCGKTYKAIMTAAKKGGFAYVAPTKLLTTEAFMNYGSFHNDRLSCGGVVLNDRKHKNSFSTYFGISAQKLKNYKTLIVDEAHWVRGHFIKQANAIKSLIAAAQVAGLDIILVTATLNFEMSGFEIKRLRPKKNMQVFQKEQITSPEAWDRALSGVRTLVINPNSRWIEEACEEDYAVQIHRNLTEDVILSNILKFIDGEATLMYASNIAEQGINLPCENLIIYVDERLDDEISLSQKIGRLGRYCYDYNNSRLTYAVDYQYKHPYWCVSEENAINWQEKADKIAKKKIRFKKSTVTLHKEDCDDDDYNDCVDLCVKENYLEILKREMTQ